MKDLRKMDIDGIERHIHNYKLFTWFLKMEGKYSLFRQYIFTEKKRTPLQLFILMNSSIDNLLFSETHDILTENIDRMWERILTYVPFGFTWVKKGVDYEYMFHLNERWVKFLKEHNYDNFEFKT